MALGKWSDIESDPDFQKLNLDQQNQLRTNYVAALNQQPDFSALPDDAKQKLRQRILPAPPPPSPATQVAKTIESGAERAGSTLASAVTGARKGSDAVINAEIQARKARIPGFAPLSEAIENKVTPVEDQIRDYLVKRGVPVKAASVPAALAGTGLKVASDVIPRTVGGAEAALATAAAPEVLETVAPEFLRVPIGEVPNAIRRRRGMPEVGQVVRGAPAEAANITPAPEAPPAAPQRALGAPESGLGLPAPRQPVALPPPAEPIRGEGFQLVPQAPRRVYLPSIGEVDIPDAQGTALSAIRAKLGLPTVSGRGAAQVRPAASIAPGGTLPSPGPANLKPVPAGAGQTPGTALQPTTGLAGSSAKSITPQAPYVKPPATIEGLLKEEQAFGPFKDQAEGVQRVRDRSQKNVDAMKELVNRQGITPKEKAFAMDSMQRDLDRLGVVNKHLASQPTPKGPRVSSKLTPEQELRANQEAEAKEMERTLGTRQPVTALAKKLGLGVNKTQLEGIENDEMKLSRLAERAFEEGLIPEHDNNMAMDALRHEIQHGKALFTPTPVHDPFPSGTFGQGGFAAIPGATEPTGPQVVRDYQSRIHGYEKEPFTIAGLKQKMNSFANELQTEILDKDLPIKQLRDMFPGSLDPDKDVRILLHTSMGSGGIADANVHLGTFAHNADGTLVKTGEPLAAIFKDMGAAWRDIETYMVAKRDVALGERSIKGLDPAKAKEVISHLEIKWGAARLKAIADRYVAWEDRAFLQPMEQLGILSPARIKAIRASGEQYVIFSRLADDAEKGMGGPSGMPIKKIKGSDRDILSPFQEVFRQNVIFTRYFEKVRVAQGIYELKDKTAQLADLLKVVPKSGPNTIPVPVKGEIAHLQVPHDVKIAFDNFRPSEMQVTTNILSIWAKMQRAGITLDPRFALFSHPVRYNIEANLYAKHGFIPGVDWLRGLAHILGKSSYYEEWMASGGDRASMVAMDMADRSNALKELTGTKEIPRLKDVGNGALYVLQRIRELGDQSVSMGVYARARNAGVDPRTAAFEARKASLDFGVHGKATQGISKLTPFFNLHLQATVRLIEALKNNPSDFMLRLSPYIALTAALWYYNKDKKEYQETLDWRKLALWHVPTPNGKFVAVPKPFLEGMLYMGGTEALLNHIYKKDPKIVDDWIKQTLEGFAPLPIPPFAKVPIELAANYSTFTRRPIVPMSKQRLLPEEQFGDFTSEAAKAIGRRAGVSPAKIDYALGQITGTLGKRALAGVDQLIRSRTPNAPQPPSRPLSPFASPSIGEASESVNRFYEYKDQLEKEHATADYKLHAPGFSLPVAPMLTIFRTFDQDIEKLKKINQVIAHNPSMPVEKKQEFLDKNNAAITNIAHNAVQIYERQGQPQPVDQIRSLTRQGQVARAYDVYEALPEDERANVIKGLSTSEEGLSIKARLLGEFSRRQNKFSQK